MSRGNLVILKLFFHYYHIRWDEILYLTTHTHTHTHTHTYISQWHNQNVIRSQKIKTSLKGFFCLIIKVFFVIIKSAYVWLSHFVHKESNKKKGWGACDALEGAWVASTHFGQRVWSLSTSKNILLSCCWKRRHVLFLLVWHYRRWWLGFSLVSLSSFISLSPPLKIIAWHSLLLLFQLQFLFFLFLIFVFSSFLEVLFVFNLILQS